MARKRKTKPTDYDNLTTDEIRAANAKLTEVVASHVAYRRMTEDDLRAIFEQMSPADGEALVAKVFAFATMMGYTPPDPGPAQPLRAGDAGAIADDVAAWLAGGV